MKLTVIVEASSIDGIKHGLQHCLQEIETESAFDGSRDAGACGHTFSPSSDDPIEFDIDLATMFSE